MRVAATSPQRMRLTLPGLASCSWKKGLATVNQLGQKPANTPDASPIRRMSTTARSSASIRVSSQPVAFRGDLEQHEAEADRADDDREDDLLAEDAVVFPAVAKEFPAHQVIPIRSRRARNRKPARNPMVPTRTATSHPARLEGSCARGIRDVATVLRRRRGRRRARGS